MISSLVSRLSFDWRTSRDDSTRPEARGLWRTTKIKKTKIPYVLLTVGGSIAAWGGRFKVLTMSGCVRHIGTGTSSGTMTSTHLHFVIEPGSGSQVDCRCILNILPYPPSTRGCNEPGSPRDSRSRQTDSRSTSLRRQIDHLVFRLPWLALVMHPRATARVSPHLRAPLWVHLA